MQGANIPDTEDLYCALRFDRPSDAESDEYIAYLTIKYLVFRMCLLSQHPELLFAAREVEEARECPLSCCEMMVFEDDMAKR